MGSVATGCIDGWPGVAKGRRRGRRKTGTMSSGSGRTGRRRENGDARDEIDELPLWREWTGTLTTGLQKKELKGATRIQGARNVRNGLHATTRTACRQALCEGPVGMALRNGRRSKMLALCDLCFARTPWAFKVAKCTDYYWVPFFGPVPLSWNSRVDKGCLHIRLSVCLAFVVLEDSSNPLFPSSSLYQLSLDLFEVYSSSTF